MCLYLCLFSLVRSLCAYLFVFGKSAGILLTCMSIIWCACVSLVKVCLPFLGCARACVYPCVYPILWHAWVFSFCVIGCVSDTALPLMSWVWRWDGFSGRRRVLEWERVNDQTWSKLPWLRHFLLSQLILKRNILNVLTRKSIRNSTQRVPWNHRCTDVCGINKDSISEEAQPQHFSIVLQWEVSKGGLMM